MHAETDMTGYYSTLSKLTGHSVRYLRVRAWVRACWPIAFLALMGAHALTPTS